MITNTVSSAKFAELLEQIRAKKKAEAEKTSVIELTSAPLSTNTTTSTDKYGNTIQYNEDQQRFIDLASSGKSCVLIGAAGTGKTTCQKGAVQALIQSGRAGVLQSDGHKSLYSDTPGIVICAFTRRAVSNIKKNMPDDMVSNCITIHKLLEFEPVYYEVITSSGETKTTMKFEPMRTARRPLPPSIHTIIFEESSMIGTELHQLVLDACPHNVQFIYLGDIQQLPPVFGPAVLGFKLLELPVIELTHVYRQALDSPIISLAHRILSGNPMPAKEFERINKLGKLTIKPWKKKIEDILALNVAAQFFAAAYDNKAYEPGEDMILMPFNKSFGTIELNKKIANHIAKSESREVYEIIAGFNKMYLSVGDRVMFDKEDAIVTKIDKNPAYYGAHFQPHSVTLDYWGHDSVKHAVEEESDEDIDFLLSQVAAGDDDEDRVKKASHIVTLQMLDTEREINISTAGDLNALLLGYALTVHKAQGSEWRKVFFLSHQSNATMLQRELLYTAVTRAKEELYIICEPEMFVKGITSQRVKGNTLAEKAEYFKGKLETIGGK